MSYKVVQYGMGPIGVGMVRCLAERADVEIVGAVDVDPEKTGKGLSSLTSTPGLDGIEVTDQASEMLRRTRPDVAIVTTTSAIEPVAGQIAHILEAGVNIVSTCEELVYPWFHNAGLAKEIDELARTNGATVLSTGVNPGFLMDTWPVLMSGLCQEVRHVHAKRFQDASNRRGPFQKKIGAGKTREEFQTLVDEGTIRHVGVGESIAMIAAGLGWKLDDIEETIEPVLAEAQISTEFVDVEPGQAAGVLQVGRGLKDGKEIIKLEFQAAVGQAQPFDSVTLTGKPDLRIVIEGGTHGDIATTAIVVNAIPKVVAASPGLVTMKDLPAITGLGS